MLDFGKLGEGKSLAKRKRKVLISTVQINREEGFKQRFVGSGVVEIRWPLGMGERKRQEDDSELSHIVVFIRVHFFS